MSNQEGFLSCRDARLVLRIMNATKGRKEMNELEASVLSHYARCHQDCQPLGLAEIRGHNLSCQQAILQWAQNLGALWLGNIWCHQVINGLLAVEHVWGKFGPNDLGGFSYDWRTACQREACSSLRQYWQGIPMNQSTDGPEGVYNELPLIISIFRDQGWPLDAVLSIQKKRVSDLLTQIHNDRVEASSGHYHTVEDLIQEVIANIGGLQQLLNK